MATSELAIVQSEITRGSIYHKRGRIWRRWGREGIVGGGGVYVDVAKGESSAHLDGGRG